MHLCFCNATDLPPWPLCPWPLRHTADIGWPWHCTCCTHTCVDTAAAWLQTWRYHRLHRAAPPLSGLPSAGHRPCLVGRRRREIPKEPFVWHQFQSWCRPCRRRRFLFVWLAPYWNYIKMLLMVLAFSTKLVLLCVSALHFNLALFSRCRMEGEILRLFTEISGSS